MEGIDAFDWHEALADGLGAVYESLLQRNASEARSGAGQYFTPRPLVDAMVQALQPVLGETIQDPAAGTAGFLISAQTYITERNDSAAYARNPPHFQAVEIEGDTYRLCLMNMFLQGMDGKVIHGHALTHDAEELTSPDVIIANPPFGTSVGGQGRCGMTCPTEHLISSLCSFNASFSCCQPEVEPLSYYRTTFCSKKASKRTRFS